jgi:hypothetical protein
MPRTLKNRYMRGEKRWALGLVSVGSLCGLMLSFASAPAHADPELLIFDQTTDTILGTFPSTDPVTGTVDGVTYSISGTVAQLSGGPQLDLNFQLSGTASSALTLDALYVDTDAGTGLASFVSYGSVSGNFSTDSFYTGTATESLSDVNVLAQFLGQNPAPFTSLTEGPVSSSSTISGAWDLGVLDQFVFGAGDSGQQSGDILVAEVPEPTTFALFGASLLGLALFLGRRRLPVPNV